jgi:hypothetical protein
LENVAKIPEFISKIRISSMGGGKPLLVKMVATPFSFYFNSSYSQTTTPRNDR